MSSRLSMKSVSPAGYAAMMGLERYVSSSSIDAKLRELIKIRASQVNGCAFCIDMHTKDARTLGESERRIYALNAWREAPFFTPAERCVLSLTEEITLIADTRVSDEVYAQAREHFEENQIAEIIMCIVTINAWNRIAISTRLMPSAD